MKSKLLVLIAALAFAVGSVSGVIAFGGINDDGNGNFNLVGKSYSYPTRVATAASGSTTLRSEHSGTVAANTGTSGTTTFVLPTPKAGEHFCFVEGGDAGGELLVNVPAGVIVVGKTHGAENGTGIATAAGTGIKNTAATNVRGDHACVVAISTTQYAMYSVAGVWASQ